MTVDPRILWERCGALKNRRDTGFMAKCSKKIGHTGEHADTKQFPAYRWKDNPSDGQEK